MFMYNKYVPQTIHYKQHVHVCVLLVCIDWSAIFLVFPKLYSCNTLLKTHRECKLVEFCRAITKSKKVYTVC